MKNLLAVTFILCLFSINAVHSQNVATSATDEAALPYNTVEILNVINDAINNPTEYNQYVVDFMKENEFPANNSEADVKSKWIIENPGKIEQLLIARKKNHDKYYMPLIKE